MKKFALSTLLLGALTGGFASSAQADDCSYNPCCPPSCCEWSFSDGKFHVGADYLYWKTEADHLDFGSRFTPGTTTVRVPSTTPGSSSSSSASSLSGGTAADVDATFVHRIRPKFKYDSGFRVWAGYELPCDLWEIGVAYTYMPSHASTGIFSVTPPVSGAVPTTTPTNEIIVGYERNLETTAAKWNSTFQYLDVDIARTLKFGECFRLRPHIGFRAAWGDQKYRQVSLFATSTVPGANVADFRHGKETFQGYGVEGGLWADYNIGYGISIVGHVGGSILYTKIKLKESTFETVGGVPPPGIGETFVANDSHHTAIPSTDIFVGLCYCDNFCDFDFNVHAGWEQHVWFDLQRLTANHGNLSTQGLTVGLDVGF